MESPVAKMNMPLRSLTWGRVTDTGPHALCSEFCLCAPSQAVCPGAALSSALTVGGTSVGRPISGRHGNPLMADLGLRLLIAFQTFPQPAWHFRKNPPRLPSSSLRLSLASWFFEPDFLGPISFSFTDISSNEILVRLTPSWHLLLRGPGLIQHATLTNHFIIRQPCGGWCPC